MRTFVGLLIAVAVVSAACSSPVPTSGSGPSQASAVASPAGAGAQAATILGRYSDGIPKEINGQPVLRGRDVLDTAQRAATSAPFLVGLWLDAYFGPRSCPIDTTSFPPGSWLHGCPTGISPSDDAGGQGSVLAEFSTATFRFATGLTSGPAVLVVHVHDARATKCGSDEPACDRMIVVDRAIWTGDAATAPRPITVAAVQRALAKLEPAVPFVVAVNGEPMYDAAPRDATSVVLGLVHGQIPAEPGPHLISGAYVLPSIDAIRRALPGVGDGVAGSIMPAAFHWATSTGPGLRHVTTARWLVVDNVALSVVLASETPTAADSAYMQTLVDALRAVR